MPAIFRVLWLVVLCCWLPASSLAQTLPFGISLPPSLNFATSPSPIGSGARAAGKGFAFIAVADDATAASWNPGGLVQLQRPEVSLVGSYYLRVEEQDVTRPNTAVGDQTLHSFDLNYLSVVYPFELFQRNVVVALNYQRLFDLQSATDVASGFTSNRIDGTQRVHSRQDGALFTISPALAVQLTPALSVGVAFNIWPDILDNGWEQDVTVRGEGFVPSGPRVLAFESTGRIEEDYAFSGFNVTAGFLWRLNSLFTLGGVFRSPFRAEVTRQHTSSITVTLQDRRPVTSALSFRETLDMDMPLSYGLGLAARLSDSLTLSLDVTRVHWSDFRLEESTRDDVLLVENGAPSGKGSAVLSGQGQDTTSVRLGAEYLWLQPPLLRDWFAGGRVIMPLRAGFFYDPEPGDGSLDHFFGFSLGTGIAVGRFILDIAYMLRTGVVDSEATDTTVSLHSFLTSIIYHF
jgi:long-subunit fatty acid transport protein